MFEIYQYFFSVFVVKHEYFIRTIIVIEFGMLKNIQVYDIVKLDAKKSSNTMSMILCIDYVRLE